MSSELDFCRHLMAKYYELWNKGRADFVGPFLNRVDEVADNAPGYYTTIKNPMCMARMVRRLSRHHYPSAQTFKADFDVMIENCRDYNKDNPEFVEKFADRFVKDFEWEWESMRRWMAAKRREIARSLAAAAAAADEQSAVPGASAPGDEELRASGASAMLPSVTSQGNGMATPEPAASPVASSSSSSSSKRSRQNAEEDVDDENSPKRVRVSGTSEDAIDVLMTTLRRIMAEQLDAIAVEKAAEMQSQMGGARALWEKIWGPERHEASIEMWRAKCFSKITAEQWPGSLAAVKAEVEQAWSETSREQLELVELEEAAEAEALAARKAEEKAQFLRHLQ